MARFSAPFVPTLVNNINGIHLARGPLVFFFRAPLFLAAPQNYMYMYTLVNTAVARRRVVNGSGEKKR
jgi:hypothetical protein